MKLKIIILLLFTFSGVFHASAQTQSEINMLFIGNSFTMRHDLSELVKEVIEEGKPGLKVNVVAQGYGGQSLFQHTEYYFTQSFIEESTIENSTIQSRIDSMNAFLQLEEVPEEFVHFWEDVRGQKVDDFPKSNIETAIRRHEFLLTNNPRIEWDYVVLQSWLDEIPDLNDGYSKYARYLSNIAKAQGAEVILYVTAPDIQNQSPVSDPVNQENVNQEIQTILELARLIEPAAVVHVPLAINQIQQGGTDLTFRYVNDFHPNQRTAYLTANLFYASIFNESTEGFAFNTVIENNPKENEPGLDPDGNPAKVVFEGEEKTFLQQIAFEAASEFLSLWEKKTSVSNVSIKNPPQDTLFLGDDYQLYAEVEPLFASNKKLTWEISSGNALTVDENGLLKTVREGSAVVKVTSEDGNFSDSCTVNVAIEIISVYRVSIGDCPKGIIKTGDTLQLIANVAPQDASNDTVSWFSSDPDVAIVDENGFVRAISQGSVVITVKTVDGSFTDKCSIGIMSSGIDVESVEMQACPANPIVKDSVFQLTAAVFPSNAADLGVGWVSSDETIATVDENGVVSARAAGKVVLIVHSNTGEKSDSCKITIVNRNAVNKYGHRGEKLKVYPNPVKDKLYFNFPDSGMPNEIRIFDFNGKLRYKEEVNTAETSLEMSAFGDMNIFLVQVISQNISNTFKISCASLE